VPGDARCAPSVQRPEEIEQLSFRGDPRRLTLRGRDGTSMAAPHVAAAAALVIASGVLGPDPSPRDVKLHLRATARDLGEEFSYGAGLVDVAATPSARPAVSRPGAGTARASSGTGS
jgi:serine protease